MKILLINNYQQGNETETFEALQKALARHSVERRRYHPGMSFDDDGKELIILSGGGGEGSEINDKYRQDKLWYEGQMKYVLSAKKPILGICMGFEVIARAYGSQVVQLKEYVTGFKELASTKTGQSFIKNNKINQYENHIWRVPTISPKDFDVLADSENGIEMIKHKTRPILATQFHPERGGTLRLEELLAVV